MNDVFGMSTEPTGEFEKALPAAGLTQGVLTGLIDLGTQESEFEGKKKQQRKVTLEFTLPTQLHVYKEEDGEQPMKIYRDVTLSLNPKATLNGIVTGILGKSLPEQYNLTDLLGVNCAVNIVHVVKGDKTYANAASFSPAMAEWEKIEFPTRVLTLGEDFSQDVFNDLPEWKQEIIKKSPEFLPF